MAPAFVLKLNLKRLCALWWALIVAQHVQRRCAEGSKQMNSHSIRGMRVQGYIVKVWRCGLSETRPCSFDIGQIYFWTSRAHS
eukprot:6485175-Amphidinium_carterae.1